LLVLAMLGALWLGGWASRRWKDQATRGNADLLVGGASGLLALLIGFSFAMAAERYQSRRELVVAEANALSTAYWRDSLLPAPYGPELGALLVKYGRDRLAFFAAGESAQQLADAKSVDDADQLAIWRDTAGGLRQPQTGPLATAILNATNELFDLAATRQAALKARTPAAVFWLLALSAIATSGLFGYGVDAAGSRHRVAAVAVVAMVAGAILLVQDLDLSRGGFILTPQGPMANAVAELRAHEADRAAFTVP
jgi:hypothetical protein